MAKDIQLYINVNPDGSIKKAVSGENIVASEDYDFFFMKPEEIANQIHLYKVVMNGMVKDLVLKDLVLKDEITPAALGESKEDDSFYVNEEWEVIDVEYEEIPEEIELKALPVSELEY
ncbi:hypothetical protein [Planococcus dechangensis]|uniref:Uncharacterized protein n=1 Tax=Planococcus dechangensis TaxID=1176255 RepID=A0ABV9M8T0_9BACL